MCTHTLGGPGGLPCTNAQPHTGGGKGCTHAGTWVPDNHDKTEATDD